MHVLYTELKETLTLVMNRFLKNELVAGKDLIKVDLSIAENLKPVTELEISQMREPGCQNRLLMV